MFIELVLEDGTRTIIKVEDIESVIEKTTRGSSKAKVIVKNRYYYTRTSYETLKELINKCMIYG